MRTILTVIVILVVLILGWLYWSAAEREKQIAAEYPPIGSFIDVNGTKVHYIQKGEGLPLVLIHGLSSNVMEWDTGLFDQLAEHFRVIAFDRPGLGYTEPLKDATIVDQANLLADAAIQLGADKPLVLGHSFGGAVAMAWAVERQENMAGLLVLSGASHPLKSPDLGDVWILANPVIGSLLAWFQLAMSSTESLEEQQIDVFAPQAVPQNYAKDFGAWLVLRRFSAVENMRQLSKLNEQISKLTPRYEEIALPVEVVHGNADNIVAYADNAPPLPESIKGANLVTLDDMGHAPNYEVPDVVEEAVLRLAKRLALE